MATTGAFDDITTEIKNLYPTGSFDIFQRTEGSYRPKLKKNNDYGMNEGIVKFPMKTNGMWNVGYQADNTSFPTPNDPTVVQAQLTPVAFTSSIQVGVKTKAAAKSGRSTFNPKGTLADRIETNAKELAALVNSVYAGSNRGRLAVVESDGSNTFVAAKPMGVELLREGMQIDAYTAISSGSVRDSLSGRRITTIDYSTRTVTYSGADQTLVAGDSIFIANGYTETPVGLPDIVDDGTLSATIFGITRSSNPKTKANIFANGGSLRDITEQILLEAADVPRRRFGKKINRVVGNSGQARQILKHLVQDRRFAGPVSDGKPVYGAGYDDKSLPLSLPGSGTIFYETDNDMSPRTVYLLAWDTFFLYEAMGLDWIDDDSLLKMIPGSGVHKSGFVAYMGSVENQGNLFPAANSRVDDLNDPICGD